MRCAYAALLFAAAAHAFTVPGAAPISRASTAARLNLRSSNHVKVADRSLAPALRTTKTNAATATKMEYDYDVVIVGCGVGGHGAALHARSQGLKTCVLSGGDVGGTCVNRGCVPSKALLAASGRVRAMQDDKHLAALGISVGGEVTYEREKVAAHANNLASTVKKNLGNSLTGLGVTVFEESGKLIDGKTVSLGGGKTLKADNVILATGSVSFVPPGVQTDGKP